MVGPTQISAVHERPVTRTHLDRRGTEDVARGMEPAEHVRHWLEGFAVTNIGELRDGLLCVV
jgi:hypothetical protein